ncbi:hypothetical protein SERLA73DRAFT_178564 [Serpula lacrymans var. lacrymans S7.3]|uniref:Uncharacterized protein n=2 Tax=Serpula lacrymans var. lacrymans TaxID=341189 RepID=F8PS17_SERL3|nr:uncharacterized protein SERLADRAFT_463058 [Serpula lacrymans var. lacrymans S7.9]EGO00683.1 hypothetical protein SERLA73DRAFT_178564 [Serpula lacrymans var. lacrymans S7.3]EGO26235.1 hypothetical protein SERLADRAFT_463058 [Serpula lacrymans var. lacrymans S7.9]
MTRAQGTVLSHDQTDITGGHNFVNVGFISAVSLGSGDLCLAPFNLLLHFMSQFRARRRHLSVHTIFQYCGFGPS